ncbi:hypothetical protein [Micromonospora noduli]|uniref:hypothetical protein n=1 Tax=Micromonospora noduli TaxID=709876 RepID=UPI000DD6802F|nr:hypothetical protein [Micromonospora noduli]KAB1925159.1 hypothetical protein F8280_12175 [Micromonospora noduli]
MAPSILPGQVPCRSTVRIHGERPLDELLEPRYVAIDLDDVPGEQAQRLVVIGRKLHRALRVGIRIPVPVEHEKSERPVAVGSHVLGVDFDCSTSRIDRSGMVVETNQGAGEAVPGDAVIRVRVQVLAQQFDGGPELLGPNQLARTFDRINAVSGLRFHAAAPIPA